MLYGGEINKSINDVNEPFRISLSAKPKKWNAFSNGKAYQAPKKRRMMPNAGLHRTAYDLLVEDRWNNDNTRSQPDSDDQSVAIAHIDENLEAYDAAEQGSIGSGINRTAWRYLYSCLQKRVSEDAPVFVMPESQQGQDELRALDNRRKATVLHTLRSSILPALLDEDHEYHASFVVLHHAVKWGQLLLKLEAEPRVPRLREKSEMHRGVRDFVFTTPSGAHLPTQR